MTASQARKRARRARSLSTGHGRARPDIRLSSQIVRQFAELEATRRSFMTRFAVTQPARSARSQSISLPAAPKSPYGLRHGLTSPQRDFLPWRLSDAGGPDTRRRPSSGRHPKPFT
jgi:hypothetical protein